MYAMSDFLFAMLSLQRCFSCRKAADKLHFPLCSVFQLFICPYVHRTDTHLARKKSILCSNSKVYVSVE